ncbi:MAG: SWIM zinc finger family protein [Thermodesulfobacteriota bacterium]|nr:SWIM zinc finger family protein [Thermodesulfobacteriota bacterium]
MSREISKANLFKELTWDDLQEWAGSRILSRGQTYQRSHRVKDLAQTQKGSLVAWVYGGQKYATEVDFEDGELISVCACPYGNNCKHAVAVVLEYLDHLKKNIEVPQVAKQDQRLSLLENYSDEVAWEEEEEDGEYEEMGDTENLSSKRVVKPTQTELKGFLEEQSREQLIALIEDMAERHSVVREDLRDRQNLSKGSVKRIVADVRKEIRELSSKPGWRNHWNHEGYTPDYSRVKGRLKSLLAKGHADEVVALGKELLDEGIRLVEMSDDEGETGIEISSCLDIVFQALPRSSLSPVEQVLWAVNAELDDKYELCYGAESFWKKKQKASDWSAVAEKLIERLKNLQPLKGVDNFSRSYHRDSLTNWIIRALENSGRHEEIIPLCEQEAVITGSYTRLVDVLRKAKRLEEAEQWIHKGIQATQKQWPGIAGQLRDALREMREKEGNWDQAASFRAEEFLYRPSLESYKEMRKSSERAKAWPAVRRAALLYLETGKPPQADSSWPLSETGLKEDRETRKSEFPMTAVLIDIAIEEKRPEDVLRWYDHQKSKKGVYSWHDGYQEDNVAEAVAGCYPDRALTIWKSLAERQIALTKPKAYEEAARYLRKVHSLLKKLKREEEWKGYLLKLQQTHIRKTKMMEILNRIEGRRIIDGR